MLAPSWGATSACASRRTYSMLNFSSMLAKERPDTLPPTIMILNPMLVVFYGEMVFWTFFRAL